MLKICHITSAHPRYDIRIFVKECVTLAKSNYIVSLIVADNEADEVNDNVAIYSVDKPQSRGKRMRETPKKIYTKILQLKPDVIHFHDPELMFIGLKLAKQGFKVVYDVHEDLPKQVLNKHWIPKIIRPIISKFVTLFEGYCAKYFHGIITATPIIAKRFQRYNSNTKSICNYPLLSELNNTNTDWNERKNLICYIGSISQNRGIIPIVSSLVVSKFKLELAGPFSGDINLGELQEIPGGEYINYLGILNRVQIAALLQRVKIGLVTLLPTPSYIESLPIKLFEYMLAGIPVVASNFSLWQEIIEINKCGVLVNPHNPVEIANACQQLMAHSDLAKQMGENGRRAVIEQFNWECESKKLIEFYTF